MNGKNRENYLKCFIRNFEDEKWLFDAGFSIARQGEISKLSGWESPTRAYSVQSFVPSADWLVRG